MDVGLLDAADLDALSITTIRTLCIDAVQQANSGHPGTPAMAPVRRCNGVPAFSTDDLQIGRTRPVRASP